MKVTIDIGLGNLRARGKASAGNPLQLMQWAIGIISLLLLTCHSAYANVAFTSTVDQPTGRPWIGFGYNQDPLDRDASCNNEVTPWATNHWNMLVQRMAAVRPGVVRIMLNQSYFNPSHLTNNYTWNSPAMQAVYQVFDWCKSNNVQILSGPWSLTMADYGNVDSYDTNGWWLAGFQSTEYPQICADLMYQLYVVKGYTNILYFTPQNEPQGCAGMTYSIYSTCITNLTSAFQAKGLSTRFITGPDGWDPYMRYAAQFDSGQIFSYENHAYSSFEGTNVISGSLETMFRGMYGADIYQYDNTKPGLLGESGATDARNVDLWYLATPLTSDALTTYVYGLNCFDYGLQVIRGGQSASMLWSLDGFAYGYNGKDSGMWSWCTSNPLLGGTTLRPHFYSWSMLSRYFPRGMTMYRMTQPEGTTTRIAAGQQLNPDGSGHWTIGIVNQGNTAETITVQIPGWAGGSFDVYTFSPASHGDGSSLTLPATTATTSSLQVYGVVVSVPASSAVLLTTLNRAPIQPTPTATLFDPLNDFSRCYSYTNLLTDNSQPWFLQNDAGRATDNSGSFGNLIYRYTNWADFKVKVFGYNGANALNFYSSADGSTWRLIQTAASQQKALIGGGWATFNYVPISLIPTGANFLKIEYPAASYWGLQVGEVSIYPPNAPTILNDALWDCEGMFSRSNLIYNINAVLLGSANLYFAQQGTTNDSIAIYRYPSLGGFDIKVFGADLDPNNKIITYGSPDNLVWTQIATTNSAPDQSDGVYWCDSHYYPMAGVPTNVNFLKIILVNNGVSWKSILNAVTLYPALPITFSTPKTVSGDADVVTNGALVSAWSLGGASTTVNGVTFAGSSSTFKLSPAGSTYNGFGNTVGAFSSLSASYKTLLKNGRYGLNGATLSFTNLLVGHQYVMQLWVNDSRSGYAGAGNYVTLSGVNTVNLLINGPAGASVGGVGQYTIGSFTAAAASVAILPQIFTMNGNWGDTYLNAIQLRDTTVNLNSTNITASVSGGQLTLSWPPDHTGWLLQSQTNSLTLGLSGTWYPVIGSTATNSMTIPIDPAQPTVFYRLKLNP